MKSRGNKPSRLSFDGVVRQFFFAGSEMFFQHEMESSHLINIVVWYTHNAFPPW